MASRNLSRFSSFGKKIIGIGKNYSEHAKEMGSSVPSEPVVFLKPTTAYLTEGNPILLPLNNDVDHEVELGVVIGKPGKDISESSAMSHVGGYVLALDMSNRTRQAQSKNAGLPWALSKGFDTSCPVSKFLDLSQVPDPHSVQLWLKVNGVERQNGNTADMVFKIPTLISYLSCHMTLEEGDLILTGTPKGVGPVKHGDVVECGLGDIVSMTFNAEDRK
ncbi:hypothetical protein CAPTEDRAFT_176411 [Capitella teleta]|uniref:Oxaloacetate tautomerase FAHD1, mitochondrial n=1 Tax=Capitella teleta TaxID=283909 RepID=R7TL10_CAPTE|nr:hypothetical protein CAPTEDRAFT_176411 [Capitella teleta]|eukprot:ELT94207.1 hypothetical protein CAPTEDRAFT_176411 [Capitella teleta]